MAVDCCCNRYQREQELQPSKQEVAAMAELMIVALVLALAMAGAVIGIDSRPGIGQAPRSNI